MFDLNSPFSVVDVETTGQRVDDGAIIEIGIVRINRGVIVDQFRSFVRPPVPVSSDVSFLTGIADDDLVDAPVFEQLWPRIRQQLEGAYFVAHNVEFDYSFLKAECSRIDEPFYADRFCTVKLSRKFFPGRKHHNLDDLSSRFGIKIENRHRALDDARATAQILIEFLKRDNAQKIFDKFAAKFELSARWIERLRPHLDKVPKSTGVYMFKDVYDLPLYIGKSRNMYNRLLSHLREDDFPRKKKLLHHTHHFDSIECGSELEALILESRLIKKHQPYFNIEQTRRKGYVFVKVTRDDYPRMFIVKEKSTDDAVYVGPFQAARFADYLIENLQKHFKLCPELLRQRRTRKGLCFAYHLHQCDGACDKRISAERYRERIEEVMDILFEFTRLDNKKSIDRLLKTRELRKSEWSPFRNALRRMQSKLRHLPEFLDQRLLVVHPSDAVGYLVIGGTLKKVYRGEELDRMGDIRDDALSIELSPPDDDDVLDQRLTIQRYISANRDKLKLYNLEKRSSSHATG